MSLGGDSCAPIVSHYGLMKEMAAEHDACSFLHVMPVMGTGVKWPYGFVTGLLRNNIIDD